MGKLKPNPLITSMVDVKKDPITSTTEDTIASTDTTEDRGTTTMETTNTTHTTMDSTMDTVLMVVMATDTTSTTTPVDTNITIEMQNSSDIDSSTKQPC